MLNRVVCSLQIQKICGRALFVPRTEFYNNMVLMQMRPILDRVVCSIQIQNVCWHALFVTRKQPYDNMVLMQKRLILI